MEVAMLGSGSAGNATLLRGGGVTLLVDAGLSCRQMEARLATLGVSPAEVDGILLTHEHTDHTSGLRVFCKKWPTRVFCNSQTASALPADIPRGCFHLFETGSRFALGGLMVRAFPVPHDAMDPVGFRIEEDGVAFGFLTDLGHANRLVLEAMRGIQGLLIEMNYDEELLQQDTKRPWSVKQRIASRHGHLSNAEAARALASLDAPELETLILCHLSRDCNSPRLATEAAHQVKSSRTILCATQWGGTPAVSVG